MKDYLSLAKEFQDKKLDDDTNDRAGGRQPPRETTMPSRITIRWSPPSSGALPPPKAKENRSS
jgi:hypothetical protein